MWRSDRESSSSSLSAAAAQVAASTASSWSALRPVLYMARIEQAHVKYFDACNPSLRLWVNADRTPDLIATSAGST